MALVPGHDAHITIIMHYHQSRQWTLVTITNQWELEHLGTKSVSILQILVIRNGNIHVEHGQKVLLFLCFMSVSMFVFIISHLINQKKIMAPVGNW